MRPERLSEDEIARLCSSLPDWSVLSGALHREFRFRDFSEAFAFMTRVAMAAERGDHHPEWSNVYNRVVVDLRTHDAGGLTTKDFDLARVIDRLLESS